MWKKMAEKSLADLAPEDPRRTCVVSEIPEAPSKTSTASTSDTNKSTATAPPQTQTQLEKIRHDWYQNSENVYFTLLAKGVPKDKAQIEIREQS
jgi:suppressor of G2 allele of SKP1